MDFSPKVNFQSNIFIFQSNNLYKYYDMMSSELDSIFSENTKFKNYSINRVIRGYI